MPVTNEKFNALLEMFEDGEPELDEDAEEGLDEGKLGILDTKYQKAIGHLSEFNKVAMMTQKKLKAVWPKLEAVVGDRSRKYNFSEDVESMLNDIISSSGRLAMAGLMADAVGRRLKADKPGA